eukprot:CAMPEP_0114559444 /NCGR_PEP_ID=MMETSP0114-20121206/10925_1 /TAXON_ID=31324 /ORGANISM="Goniomonas sp, Strain m" /LENGTH=531 /DNA_ID=CAMNT_0001744915 /DNA_START=18 /DNA_END=1613 /DNA_ORIENTATION=-
MASILLLLTSLLAVTYADDPRNGWTLVHKLSAESAEIVPVRLGLKQNASGLHELERRTLLAASPSSNEYGRWLSLFEVTALVAPPAHAQELVIQWLRGDEQIQVEVSINGDYISAHLPITRAESLFAVKFSSYRRGNVFILRSETSESLPPEIAEVVDFVTGVSDFPIKPTRFVRAAADPGENVTPPLIQKLYSITAQGKDPSNGVAVAEFEEAYFYPSDLATFLQTYHLPSVNATIVGPNKPMEGYLGECSLDVEYVTATAPNVKVWDFSVEQPGFDLVAWSTLVMSTPDAPKVHSISWGSPESKFDDTFITKANTEFSKLSAQGYTIFVASGDSGTGHSGIFTCGHFLPQFPASSPWVTAVGGTYHTATENGGETAWALSGGGFSNFFPRQSWQAGDVASYLSHGTQPKQEYFNSTGRGIPDVAALATNFQVLIQNYTGSVSGTSAASPTWAGVIALLNDARLADNKAPMGFLNPWLYGLKSVGFDVTAGSNRVHPCHQGFEATAGWDAVTGLGTPNYETLLAAIANLP